MTRSVPPNPANAPPPRAFAQGVGTVYQFTGVVLFLALMTLCCGSGLLSKETAQRHDLTRVGWRLESDPPGAPTFSAQRMISLGLVCGVAIAMAVAGAGLGLQAMRRHSPAIALAASACGTVLWAIELVFAAGVLRSMTMGLAAGLLLLVFIALLLLAVGAWKDMRASPPPVGSEILPADYKVPYSWYHQDPPEVRLANEIEQRRQRLEVQRKELEALEKKVREGKEGGA